MFSFMVYSFSSRERVSGVWSRFAAAGQQEGHGTLLPPSRGEGNRFPRRNQPGLQWQDLKLVWNVEWSMYHI